MCHNVTSHKVNMTHVIQFDTLLLEYAEGFFFFLSSKITYV